MSKKLLNLALLPVFAVLFGATANAEDLNSVVKTAIEKNPEVQVQWFKFIESTDNQRVMRGGYLPSVDLNAAYGTATRDFDSRGWYEQNQVELSLTQMLFDGFRVRSRVAQGDFSALKNYYDLNASIEQKAMEAAQAYLDVQRYRELVKFAEANLENHKQVYAQIEQRASQGVSNRADLSQITGRVSLAQTNLMTEQANLYDVSARYARLIGTQPPAELQPVNLTFAVPGSVDEVVNNAFSHNNSLKAAVSEIQYATANAEEFKSAMYPKLNLVARTGLYQNRNGFYDNVNDRNHGQESALEVQLKYNLFNGGSDRAAINAANARILQAEDLKNKTCVDIRQTASIAHNNVTNYTNQLEWLKRHRDESVAVVQAYHDQFDIGRRTLLDVLDSQNEAFQANRSYTSAEYDLKIAKLQTIYSMGGQILPVLGLQRDNLPNPDEVADRATDFNNICAAGYQALAN